MGSRPPECNQKFRLVVPTDGRSLVGSAALHWSDAVAVIGGALAPERNEHGGPRVVFLPHRHGDTGVLAPPRKPALSKRPAIGGSG